jgi:hypothetical protein
MYSSLPFSAIRELSASDQLGLLFFGDFLLCSKFPNVFGDFDEHRQPANLALRLTFNVIYPAAPAQSRVHVNADHTF